jgi:hypothetical protein
VECCEYTIKAKSEMQDASKRIIAAAESQPEVSRDRKCESRTEAAIFLFVSASSVLPVKILFSLSLPCASPGFK